MTLGDKFYPITSVEIMDELRLEVLKRGLPYFSEIKSTTDNIMTNCPFHKGGVERKPSFGIQKMSGECNCFTCGPKGTIDNVISQVLFKAQDDGLAGRRWLSSKFLDLSIETRPRLDISQISSRERAPEIITQPFSEKELDSYRYYHDYMWKRGFDEKTIDILDIGYDSSTDCLTFPVYHVDNSPAFIARRSVRTKFFHYPEGCTKPVYAAHLLDVMKQMPYWNKGVIIVESVTNMVTCWVHGWPAVSLLGTGTSFQYNVLRQLPVRGYILALDPDEAGDRAEIKLRRNLGTKKILRKMVIPEGYDINDLGEKFLTLPVVL